MAKRKSKLKTKKPEIEDGAEMEQSQKELDVLFGNTFLKLEKISVG